MTQTGTRGDIVILDGGRRTPRADILINNRAPGLFSRFTTTPNAGTLTPCASYCVRTWAM